MDGAVVNVGKLRRGYRVYQLVEKFGCGVLFSEEFGTASVIGKMPAKSFKELIAHSYGDRYRSNVCVDELRTILEEIIVKCSV